ncbi:MAG: SRPBCC family protein [Crocinitomicaceae bacterium]|nr:SRPBCC family protein [Crocinitomicaceae bacterium]MBK8926754.1 SRPBCC family protein [Crocinitomicaceae bacterium]
MKYTVQTVIEKPIDFVIQLFDDPTNLHRWMEGLEKLEHLDGEPGKQGAKSKLTFNVNGKKIILTETILDRNLPTVFKASYQSKGVHNIIEARFEKTNENYTTYYSTEDFQFVGIMKILAPLMSGIFKKQSLKNLSAFKKFVESQS